ncbi:winged helix-turn-helix domain-containing protein [Haladaptatus sp. DYF46]|uniref:winged helix-turn-helix domain-containing protein n=1 Tax=Haladaptatus sp. DYF46 TaxID=2886041 RepID=UPI001E36FF8D|nr:winged helix-turn-helix domain-containing protein [Haladaptatus sp. DYF46]
MTETDITREKTERLREIFLDVADDSTVTENQEETPGTLGANSDPTEALRSIIREMKQKYGFQTSLEIDELAILVHLFYDEYSDTAIARELGNASRDKTVTRARIHLQLLRETDFNAPFDLDRLRDLREDEETSTKAIAETLGVSKSTVRRYCRILDAEQAAGAVDHRYQQQFEAALADSDPDRSIRESLDSDLDDALDASPGKN